MRDKFEYKMPCRREGNRALYGGDAGSRTQVRIVVQSNVYVCSRLTEFSSVSVASRLGPEPLKG